jgi:signal transduction histidine kinase
LRAPLRALQGFSAALVEDFADQLGEVGKGYTSHIASAAARMDLLIRDLLDYSRLARYEVKRQTVSVDEIVAAARQQVIADIESSKAEVKIDAPLGIAETHFATVVQVVANLLSNAVKFTKPGEHPQVHLYSESKPGRLRLWVVDQGIGIAPEHHTRIFKVFERLHGQDAYPGTGIGLAIVRKGVERVGGLFGVDSSVGIGSRFWIEMPVTPRTG